jgi:tricorn protease-like protein
LRPRFPSLSQDKIAFRYADDIWTVSRNGGEAERLTANGQVTAGPFYSPDGARIAYSAVSELPQGGWAGDAVRRRQVSRASRVLAS